MKSSNWSSSSRRAVVLLAGALALFSLAPRALADDYGRFLTTPTDMTRVGTYNDAAPVAFNRNVVTGGSNVRGTIAFDYDPYKGNDPNLGGAVLSGGYYMASGVTVKPGFTLNWVQTVQSDHAGANQFNLPDVGAGEFPDSDPTDAAAAQFRSDNGLPALNPTFAPAYVFTTPAAVNAPTTAPTLGYIDLPGRDFTDGAQSWTAELALVAISTAKDMNGFRTVDVVGSFLWGFNMSTMPNSVGAIGPALWGAPTGSFLSILNDYYDGTSPSVGGNDGVTTDKYNFVFEPNVFVPEPGSIVLLVLGGCGLLISAARRRSKQ